MRSVSWSTWFMTLSTSLRVNSLILRMLCCILYKCRCGELPYIEVERATNRFTKQTLVLMFSKELAVVWKFFFLSLMIKNSSNQIKKKLFFILKNIKPHITKRIVKDRIIEGITVFPNDQLLVKGSALKRHLVKRIPNLDLILACLLGPTLRTKATWNVPEFLNWTKLY